MTFAEKVYFHTRRHHTLYSFIRQYVGYYMAYTLPTAVFLLCPIVLFFGRNRYVQSPPTGSVLATSLRLLRFASRGRLSINPVKSWRQITAPDFWENAKPSKITGEARPKWMVFDDQWVDEVRKGFKACVVFCWYPIYCMPNSITFVLSLLIELIFLVQGSHTTNLTTI